MLRFSRMLGVLPQQQTFNDYLINGKFQEATDLLLQPTIDPTTRTILIFNALTDFFGAKKVFWDDASCLKFMARFVGSGVRGCVYNCIIELNPGFIAEDPNYKVTNLHERLGFMYIYHTHFKADVDAAYQTMVKLFEGLSALVTSRVLQTLDKCDKPTYKQMIERLETLGINEWKNEMYVLAANLARVEQLMARLATQVQEQQTPPEANEEKDNFPEPGN